MTPREPTRQPPREETYTTDSAVQRLSDASAQMAVDIIEIKKQLELIPFSKKISETIEESDSLKKCLKKLVWKTLGEKILYLLAAGVIFALSVYAKELITSWMKTAATETATHIVDQGGQVSSTPTLPTK